MKRNRPTNFRGVRSYKKTYQSITSLNSNKINKKFSSLNLLHNIKSKVILKKGGLFRYLRYIKYQ